VGGGRSHPNCSDRTGRLLQALEALGYNIAGTFFLADLNTAAAGFTVVAEAA